MQECTCLKTDHDRTMNDVNTMADVLSSAIILAIMERKLCPTAGMLMMGKVLAAASARICLYDMGPIEAERLQDVNPMLFPQTRQILETIIIHGQHELEGDYAGNRGN